MISINLVRCVNPRSGQHYQALRILLSDSQYFVDCEVDIHYRQKFYNEINRNDIIRLKKYACQHDLDMRFGIALLDWEVRFRQGVALGTPMDINVLRFFEPRDFYWISLLFIKFLTISHSSVFQNTYFGLFRPNDDQIDLIARRVGTEILGGGVQCPICLVDIHFGSDQMPHITSCGHVFCLRCILEWLVTVACHDQLCISPCPRPTCPFCRAILMPGMRSLFQPYSD